MDVARLQQLIALALSNREPVEAMESGRKISIDVAGAGSAIEPTTRAGMAPSDAPGPGAICAPCFGIVHLTAAPGAPPFVQVGDLIAAGQRLCLVEAMKVFNAVTAERAGRVVEIHVVSGAEVERGQPLIRLDIADGGG